MADQIALNAVAAPVTPPVEATSDTPHTRATYKDYLILTKPRVISLLLFTTWTAMVMAARGWPGTWLFVATGIGFYMAAGAAHTINMVLDRDLDLKMARTANRPVASGLIPVAHALIFAVVLEAGSFALLWTQATPLAAWMALAGLAFYVVIYTAFLKRRTWQNIVIGGAAGSFPPLVGYAAVTNHLDVLAWLLFGIIFLWTPVHFWALAIMIRDDYAEAGVPMLPVVHGSKYTAQQMIVYAVLTTMISLAPLVLSENGQPMVTWFYGLCALVLNGLLLRGCALLLELPERPRASKLFHYSMIYLALLFLALALDRCTKVDTNTSRRGHNHAARRLI